MEPETTELEVLAMVKPTGERYVFIYADDPLSRSELFRTLGRFAGNPDLDFTWYDAAVLSNKARERNTKETT